MSLNSFLHGMNLYVNRSRMVGHYPEIKPKEDRVNLYDYHPELVSYGKETRYNNSRYNLGDYLGFVIVNWMLEKRNLSLDSPTCGKKFLNSVGSNVFGSYQNCTIWGSGAMYEPKSIWKYLSYYPFRKLDVRAVRGPLTRDVVLKFGHKCPEVYGDPAILMPLIYQPEKKTECNEFCIIPQFYVEKGLRMKYPNHSMVSMNTDDYKSVIDAIVSSEKVVTSSLHGIILAESYGVPAVFFRSLDKVIDFKYLDYYYSTGRSEVRIAESIEEALEMEPLPLPDLSALQQGLLDSFPYDLWEK